MKRFRDWTKLATALAIKHTHFKRMAVMTGTQLEAFRNIPYLLDRFSAEEHSDDLHEKMTAAAEADDTKIPVIKTKD